MTDKLKNVLSKFIDNCSKTGMIYICKRIENEEGRNYVINRLYETMQMYPTWQPSQCLSQIEVELNDIENY